MSTRDRRAQPTRLTRSHSRNAAAVLHVDLNAAPPAAIDVETLDDDVIISSPRAFAEAKNNSRRNRRRVIVVDVDSATAEDHSSSVSSNSRNRRRRISTNQAANSSDIHIDLEGHSCPKEANVKTAIPSQPKEPTFNCPVCMGQLVDEMSTKCGHIFCKACIKASIAAQGKCPTCRRKITMKDTIRVYLPNTSYV